MGMQANARGIEWDRLLPGDDEEIGAMVQEAAEEYCSGVRPYTRNGEYEFHATPCSRYHYTTIGGKKVCPRLAREALGGYNRNLKRALKDALPKGRAGIFAAQVATVEMAEVA